jgi:hypothetical protein
MPRRPGAVARGLLLEGDHIGTAQRWAFWPIAEDFRPPQTGPVTEVLRPSVRCAVPVLPHPARRAIHHMAGGAGARHRAE